MTKSRPPQFIFLLVFALLPFAAFASQTAAELNSSPQLFFKTTSELKAAFEANPALAKTDAAAELAPALHAGQRAYEWINAINKTRTQPLSYSDPSTTTSPSMEKPKIYNLEISKKLYTDVAATWPAWYRAAIEDTGPLPTTLPASDAEFLALGLKTTLAYDTACRWIMMQDYLPYLESQKLSDVRGYYFLTNLKDRDQKLDGFSKLPTDDQTQIHDWVVGVCINNQGFASYDYAKCDNEVRALETSGGLKAYFAQMSPRSKEIWASAFELDSTYTRDDISWTSRDANTLHYPFLQPTNPVTLAYLRDNVEDEWKLGAWKLKLDFTSQDSSSSLSRLEYQPNTTAHAERNRIVMDENEPLTEYLSKWTIRHEFGHLLGFKDCYVEYYDTKLQAIVNYPLDPLNLMCSRRGHLQPQHLDVLRAAYYTR
jgi:hypothetical protein